MTSEVTQASLEPCPRCGGKAFVTIQFGVMCEVDRCLHLPPRENRDEAIAAWNTRLTAQSGEGRSGAGEDALGAHLRTLWEAVTAGDLSTAERHNDCELVECPMCHEGSIEAADYCNIDGKALGVQFYGIGPEHGAHERLWTAVIANFPKILAALNARQSGEGERLRKAAKRVLDGLNRRIEVACEKGKPVPVFDGIADLHTALAALRTTDEGSK